MNDEKSCGAIIFTYIDNQLKYVLVHQVEGSWGFPKGHMEECETEVETALREIYEEVGLRPTIIEGFKAYDQYKLPNRNNMKRLTYFLAEYDRQEIIIQESELVGAMLATYEEALEILEYNGPKEILRKANDFILAI